MLPILAFIVALLVLVLVHEYGHFAAARRLKVGVEEFGIGFPPAAWKRRLGNTTVSINWLPLGGFVRIKGEEGTNMDPDSFGQQSVPRRMVIVGAGIIMNLLLAAVIFSGAFMVGMPAEIGQEPSHWATVSKLEHQVVGVVEGSPAYSVLKEGDVIESLNGQKFSSRQAIQDYLRGQANQVIALDYKRGEDRQSVNLVPQAFKVDNNEVVGLGVQIFSTGRISYPVYLAPLMGIKYTGEIFYQIVSYFGTTIRDLVSGSAADIQVAGPVGIAVISGAVAEQGLIYFLQFVALLSVNLAFINLLPIPALDGGRLLFLIIEAVRGRPVPTEVENKWHRWGFAILLLLVLLVTYSDISKFILQR
jgi:regulator of sigma E protease